MNKKRTVSILVVLALLAINMIASVQPASACTAGCTPGYWKQEQHFDDWVGYAPEGKVVDVFAEATLYVDGDTLLEALNYGGGKGVDGGARILLRAAVASLLNSAYDNEQEPQWFWEWDYWYANLISQVNGALATNNRGIMLELATALDILNNEGCPL